MNQGFGICSLSVIPMRAEASDKSEMTTQLLFGDHFQILESQGHWLKICTAYDDYEGWVDSKQITEISKEAYSKLRPDAVLGLQLGHEAIRLPGNENMRLLPGSTIPFYDEEAGTCTVGNNQYRIEGKISRFSPDDFTFEIEQAARFYFNAPYLWGGKSPFGIDCSGYSQVVFKQFGMRLKRDAWQQALQGEPVAFLQESQPGDLAFFDNQEGRITHVGIMLSNQHIIHASGRVKVDKIDDQGIYSTDLNRYSHKLRVIKRYV